MCVIQTTYCNDCEHIVKLTEDGYCTECGRHYDNIGRNSSDNDNYEDLKEESDRDYEGNNMPGGDYDGLDHEDFINLYDDEELGGEG